MNEEQVRKRRIREAQERDAANQAPPVNPSVAKLQPRIALMKRQLRDGDLPAAQRLGIEAQLKKDEATLATILEVLEGERVRLDGEREQVLDLRAAQLAEKEQALKVEAEKLAALQQLLNDRESALDKREEAITAREIG